MLTEGGATYGWTQMELGVASLLGQAFHLLSPLVAFIYLLLQMTELDMGEWQKESAEMGIGNLRDFHPRSWIHRSLYHSLNNKLKPVFRNTDFL
ncbi:hypothetical protein MGH68_15695 [Erysipelothrix sp. D19-032]